MFVLSPGDLSQLEPGFELLEKESIEDNLFRSTIRVLNGENPNKLLQSLINITQVYSFMEKIPSMNDIFIAKVNEENNE